MNWDALSAIGELVGAAAVVVSLIYLSVQIRHNTRSVRGSALDAVSTRQQEELRWSSELATEMLKTLHDPESLTPEEAWRMSEWMTAAFTARQNEYFQFRHGFLDEEIWQANLAVLQVITGIEWTQNWWRGYARKNYTDSFVALVDGLISGHERNVVEELKSVLPGDRKRTEGDGREL